MNHPSLADHLIRGLAALTVVALGVAAAIVSYSHLLELALTHGQAGHTAHLTPLTVDGLVLVPSLVSLAAARRRESSPLLAHVALALGVAATLAANVLYGWAYGPIGAAIAGWPALALILSHHLLMGMIRRGGVPSRSTERPARDESVDAVFASVRTLLAEAAPRPVAPVLAAGHRPVAAARPVELPALPEWLATGRDVAAAPVPAAVAAVPWQAPPVVAEDEPGHESGQEDEVAAAGQEPVMDLASAIVAAKRADLSVRSIATEFGVSRHKVDEVLVAAGLKKPALASAPA